MGTNHKVVYWGRRSATSGRFALLASIGPHADRDLGARKSSPRASEDAGASRTAAPELWGALLYRLRERVGGLIDESKWLGEIHLAEKKLFKNSYSGSAYEKLQACLKDPEVIEKDRAALWTMANLALSEESVSDEEILAKWREETDSQTLIEWLADLDEAIMLMEPGLL